MNGQPLGVPIDHFHPLVQREAATPEDLANTQSFMGDGTPYLRVPGLKTVTRVRVGNTELPLTESRDYPTDPNLQRVAAVEHEMVRLTSDDEGPVLMRATLSNDGFWNKGAKIFVTGEWEKSKDKPGAKVPTPA